MRILVINQPGSRAHAAPGVEVPDPHSSWDIENRLKELFPRMAFEFYQPTDERTLVDAILRAKDGGAAGVLLNGALTAAPSPGIRDAIADLRIPVLIVHAANVRGDHALESAAVGVIAGLGMRGFELAVQYLEHETER